MTTTLSPIPTITKPECRQARSAERVSCGKCGKTFAGGAVVQRPERGAVPGAIFAAEHQKWAVVRQFFCDHCNHVVVWLEAATVTGVPTGEVLSGPGIVRDRKAVANFLRSHPEAAGVEQT